MNENTVGAIFIVCVTTLIILFAGDPDLIDGIIHFLEAYGK